MSQLCPLNLGQLSITLKIGEIERVAQDTSLAKLVQNGRLTAAASTIQTLSCINLAGSA